MAAQDLNSVPIAHQLPFRACARAAALLLGAFSLLMFGCVERTFAPVDPLGDMHGTWKGTRTELVFTAGGAVIRDTTVVTDLTLVLTPGSVGFIDSEAGQLPTSTTSMDNNGMVFTVTNGLELWTQTGVRTGPTLNGTETNSQSVVSGVWAVTRQ